MMIERVSPLTRKIHTMEIDVEMAQLFNWQSGALIQDAMPNLTVEEREFIKTGYTPSDWKAMFGPRHDRAAVPHCPCYECKELS